MWAHHVAWEVPGMNITSSRLTRTACVCAAAAGAMRRELHAVRESLHRSGRWLDTVGYAVLADEWSLAPPARP
jgi:hypothetical protein